MNNFPERVLITPGSKFSFWADIEDEVMGQGVNLFEKVTKVVFCNCAGDRIEIPINTSNDSARCGSIFVQGTSAQSSLFDKRSTDFDVEYIDSDGEPVIIPVEKIVEIKSRNCPPPAPLEES